MTSPEAIMDAYLPSPQSITLERLLPALAQHLPGFTPGESRGACCLHGPDGMQLSMQGMPRTYRVRLIGHVPRSSDGQWVDPRSVGLSWTLPHMTIAPHRDARTIAAEIRRRLLPEYQRLCAEMLQRIRACEAHNIDVTGIWGADVPSRVLRSTSSGADSEPTSAEARRRTIPR